ncbi:hypothetical protein B0H99_10459 [Planomicrobium soli]|uniref:Alpha-ribazole transporter n=1 Tax=Planomicrobium soli TaxID=1176648 RepID=A0A2P8H316_9BACL|nr:ECF transporter S component [Planomicrobium soli]PSL40597.1 hypothetical protein B0H99_10459 [Planomicrobium soli]
MTTRNLALAALFVSLSAIGGMLKIPLGIASIALDAMPALVAALFLAAPLAGTVAMLGHLASALYGGFPLGPFHIIIAFEMGGIVWLFATLHQSGRHLVKWIAFLLGNGIVAAFPFYFLLSPAFFYASVPGLLFASAVNALGAAFIMPLTMNRIRGRVK